MCDQLSEGSKFRITDLVTGIVSFEGSLKVLSDVKRNGGVRVYVHDELSGLAPTDDSTLGVGDQVFVHNIILAGEPAYDPSNPTNPNERIVLDISVGEAPTVAGVIQADAPLDQYKTVKRYAYPTK